MNWIKCSDRTPEKDTPVLCLYLGEYMDVMEYWYDNDHGEATFYRPPSPPVVGDVSHWMPLPPLPEDL